MLHTTTQATLYIQHTGTLHSWPLCMCVHEKLTCPPPLAVTIPSHYRSCSTGSQPSGDGCHSMAERVLETDFPLIAPPNPPLSVHPRIVGDTGRNGSLKRAYSSEEVSESTPLHRGNRQISDNSEVQDYSDTSDYLSDCQALGPGPPGYSTLPSDHSNSLKHNSLNHPPFRPPGLR